MSWLVFGNGRVDVLELPVFTGGGGCAVGLGERFGQGLGCKDSLAYWLRTLEGDVRLKGSRLINFT